MRFSQPFFPLIFDFRGNDPDVYLICSHNIYKNQWSLKWPITNFVINSESFDYFQMVLRTMSWYIFLTWITLFHAFENLCWTASQHSHGQHATFSLSRNETSFVCSFIQSFRFAKLLARLKKAQTELTFLFC